MMRRAFYLVLCCCVALAPVPGVGVFVGAVMGWSVLGKRYVPLIFALGLAPLWLTGIPFASALIGSGLAVLNHADSAYMATMNAAIVSAQANCLTNACVQASVGAAQHQAYGTMLGSLRPIIYGVVLTEDLPAAIVVGWFIWQLHRAVLKVRDRLRYVRGYRPF